VSVVLSCLVLISGWALWLLKSGYKIRS
jgi:ABC-2 type transport system permease protein